MKKVLLLLFAASLFFLMACDSTEGGGAGGLEPSDSAARIVDGFMCAGIFEGKPVGIDNEFWQDDRVYIWLNWENMSGEHRVKIIWVDPNDKLYETSDVFNSKTGELTTYFWLDTTSTAPVGQWLAEVYVDNMFLRSYSFWLNSDS